jgi:formylglycine-generating enzyme required for sulfatase activity
LVADGCETLLDADPNCGACGHSCAATNTGICVAGRCTAESANCPTGLPGPALLDAGGFCIDRTEVTRADYAAFVAQVTAPGFGPECSWKVALSPPAGASDAHPAVELDWCDADAYCRWAGKRLCGPRSMEPATVETGGEWHQAYGGAGRWPYGGEYQPWRCNLADYPHPDGLSKALPVEEPADCTGAIAGLLNMSGNVAEWVDRCDAYAGANDTCKTRGNSYVDGVSGPNVNCWLTRDSRAPTVGVRCCSDVAPLSSSSPNQ